VVPERGGEPLPPAPICLPRDYRSADLYIVQIRKALEGHGWSKRQRAILRNLFRTWTMRAEGRDPHFEQWGSFPPRWPGSPPPDARDVVIARWQKAHRMAMTNEERKAERDRAKWKQRREGLGRGVPNDPRFRSPARRAELKDETDKDED
jgi:hypothetical protein